MGVQFELLLETFLTLALKLPQDSHCIMVCMKNFTDALIYSQNLNALIIDLAVFLKNDHCVDFLKDLFFLLSFF